MKGLTYILHVLILGLICTGDLIGQNSDLAEIRNQFNRINSVSNFSIIELNNEEFLNAVPDGGGKLLGYFSGDSLLKMNLQLGLSYCTRQIEFYCVNDDLVFVFELENSFYYDEENAKFNHSKKGLKFEGRYYFKQGSILETIEQGEKLIPDQARYDSITKQEDLKQIFQEYFKILIKENKKITNKG